jgi:hypothetical protein
VAVARPAWVVAHGVGALWSPLDLLGPGKDGVRMDLKIERPATVCGITGRSFLPGEVLHSSLVRGPNGLARIDACAEAWPGPPAGAVASWRSVYPAADAAGPQVAPVDVLLDVLEALQGRPKDTAVRFLLALQLVRRRVLRIVDQPGAPVVAGELVLACRRRDREYVVATVEAGEAAAPGVAERLSALLWSGEAAA